MDVVIGAHESVECVRNFTRTPAPVDDGSDVNDGVVVLLALVSAERVVGRLRARRLREREKEHREEQQHERR